MADKFPRSVSMVSYGYNEEELIEEFLRRAHKLMRGTVEDFEIIFVNDGSTDRTGEIAKSVARELPEIRVLDNEQNMNVAFSAARAVSSASKEFVFWQMVDWCYDIEKLVELLRPLNEDADVIAGVRRQPVAATNVCYRAIAGVFRLIDIKHLSKRSDNIRKGFISVVNYMLIRLLFNIPLSDYQNVCIYRTSLVQNLVVESKSSFANPELLFKAYWSGAVIAEAEINFIPRMAGEAKGTRVGSILNSIKDIFKFWWRWKVLGRKPGDKIGTIRRLSVQK